METTDNQYWTIVRKAEEQILPLLRTFEAVHEEIHFGREKEAQERVRAVAEHIFPAITEELTHVTPPAALQDFHAQLTEAMTCCANAYSDLLKGAGRNFAEWFLRSRQALSRALYGFYELRDQLPALQPYWVTGTVNSSLSEREARTAEVAVPVGFLHKERTNARNEYSLYVPEQYTPDKNWPLIVCLHGGYGQGNEYIWTWLRPAKSHGYFLLSPKSIGPTWSVLQPPLDIRSIRAMLTEVCDTYNVDRSRVYLTGLSDGGTFSYLTGLTAADLFAAVAPIAGDFHAMMDPLLRQKRGIDVPFLIVHGGKDPIFPIQTAREAEKLFSFLGYQVTYRELPEWGHAYPYTINEQIVLPWFASLTKGEAGS
ncbi:MAG: hypothetical protein AB7G75_36740 [Candidatus Binatia bacterium]